MRHLIAWAKAAYRTGRYGMHRLIDRAMGVETTVTATMTQLGLHHPDRVGYEPSGWFAVRHVLRRSEISPRDVFVDMGSGKGRIVLAAARYPFARIIGVELSGQLSDVARRNVQTYRGRLRCRDIELVTCDATTFVFPDDVTVVYVFNAFGGATFDAVLAQLLASIDRAPRTVNLLYRSPTQHEALMATGRCTRARDVRGVRPGRKWAEVAGSRVYELR